ncbi:MULTISPECIES: class I SAM-dependent methyltransferase [Cyanophyceae]|uniref:class I SAM-dependent methyltransferase n=1 Tax=Cyanophyceae TaxID=3028117 RepID=UPI001689B98A|nr:MULTISPECIES: class I SAM-dependent methyltransferase [Cyanophyceae]MBD1914964.1 class I SAM-dependent methyltransferase [Phormidium sp. FACHB-77]MBD2032751.1 class I SAM-dependent methyltransferase [Phormidium sp. FACHB-322]MBD2049896.1 class I SAM-dependent methyltransferase [Leptolyngbya sp. FACHB-60]
MTTWTEQQHFLNEDHHNIFEKTKDIPGWQEPGDSYKLYEMGYRSGDVILEIGTYGGRSAVVELEGALANPDRSIKPQYFGIDLDINGVLRTADTLEKFNLTDYCLLFHGTLNSFAKEFSIQPTMVFVDADHRYEGVKSDLLLLKDYLVAGTPILCHDYANPENETGEMGVRQAVNEFIREGYAEFVGTFGCSAFLLTTNQCGGVARPRLSEQEFAGCKADVLSKIGQSTYKRNTALDSSKPSNPKPDAAIGQDLQQVKTELEQAQFRIQQVKTELEQAQSRIQAMESSKFWKIRLAWFKVKKMFGVLEKNKNGFIK